MREVKFRNSSSSRQICYALLHNYFPTIWIGALFRLFLDINELRENNWDQQKSVNSLNVNLRVISFIRVMVCPGARVLAIRERLHKSRADSS